MDRTDNSFALYALAAGAFGIGITEFVIMGLLPEVADELRVSTSAAGMVISGYALGVVLGAPILTIATGGWPRKHVLLTLMAVFVVGNAACAAAPDYGWLLAARVLTALAHGTFFGVGSVVATRLVPVERRASAIALMFTGLTVANVLGVPLGTWFGQSHGWRATFWAVALIGFVALAVIAAAVPAGREVAEADDWRADVQALVRPPVLVGLATTVLGYAGVFTVFTYIAPLLTGVAGFGDRAISPILVMFGGGLVVGNVLGGRLADRRLVATVLGSLATLAVVLLAFSVAIQAKVPAVLAVAALGASAFATVAPLQMWVLSRADGVGESLASSVNIAAFNLGNAIGAAVGGGVIAGGLGLASLPVVAAAFPVAALLVAVLIRPGSRVVRQSRSEQSL